mgnify:FL=1
MANIKQQKKRNRQNEKRRIKNSNVKSTIRTAAKKIVKTIESKEGKDLNKIQEYFLNFTKTIDTAAGKGIIKKNTAARKKSRLAKKVNAAIASLKETA